MHVSRSTPLTLPLAIAHTRASTFQKSPRKYPGDFTSRVGEPCLTKTRAVSVCSRIRPISRGLTREERLVWTIHCFRTHEGNICTTLDHFRWHHRTTLPNTSTTPPPTLASGDLPRRHTAAILSFQRPLPHPLHPTAFARDVTTVGPSFSRIDATPLPRSGTLLPSTAVAHGSGNLEHIHCGTAPVTQEHCRAMAGLSNGSRSELPPATIIRPGLHSQQSNSVPSTPHQKPRDLRFHSRSPSPRRSLANQSPHSVSSEAIDNQKLSRAVTGVCAFEAGSEFRKRRMPYVDGGNEELAAPKKEPKKTLSEAEQTKLTADMKRFYDLYLLPDIDSDARRQKLVEKLERILKEKWPGHDIRVSVFGSSGNLLASKESDVDICITTDIKQLKSMHSLAEVLHNSMSPGQTLRATGAAKELEG